ncbi:tol-pal system-associated acyl-CoA thioesterase [Echinimonas agarilytica]|uniref:Tol-pal system-associated acyl-CoA thioesterase n=1 Tax=Echinimonas agarilytica TaxID=1215918 RepID=A0AA41W653_9GAMM|nr:tol-pal system-associated acyl-CoA thioesterase [Echinimonas agarilytica]
MTTELLSFEWPIRVYYEDTDAGGVVFYANYLKFMERARTEWLRQMGIEQDLFLTQGIAFMVRRTEVDYRAPAVFNDELIVVSQIVQKKRASLIFQQTIQRKNEVSAIVTGQVTIACVDLERGKPIAIPKSIMEVLARVG